MLNFLNDEPMYAVSKLDMYSAPPYFITFKEFKAKMHGPVAEISILDPTTQLSTGLLFHRQKKELIQVSCANFYAQYLSYKNFDGSHPDIQTHFHHRSTDKNMRYCHDVYLNTHGIRLHRESFSPYQPEDTGFHEFIDEKELMTVFKSRLETRDDRFSSRQLTKQAEKILGYIEANIGRDFPSMPLPAIK